MRRQFYFDFCRQNGQIQRHYGGKTFRQIFATSGSASMMQRYITNTISKNKHLTYS